MVPPPITTIFFMMFSSYKNDFMQIYVIPGTRARQVKRVTCSGNAFQRASPKMHPYPRRRKVRFALFRANSARNAARSLAAPFPTRTASPGTRGALNVGRPPRREVGAGAHTRPPDGAGTGERADVGIGPYDLPPI